MCVVQRGSLHKRACVFCSAGRCMRRRVCFAARYAFGCTWRPPASLTIVRTRPPVPHAARSGGGEIPASSLALLVHEQEPPLFLILNRASSLIVNHFNGDKKAWGSAPPTERSEIQGGSGRAIARAAGGASRTQTQCPPQNTHALLCNGPRCTTRTSSLNHREKGGCCITRTSSYATARAAKHARPLTQCP